jgi:hypothetical protein
MCMPKNKTKKTKAKRTQKQPLDPRLQRVFDVLEAAYENLDYDSSRNVPVFDQLVNELLDRLNGGVAELAGAKRTILALAVDVEAEPGMLDACVEIAEKHHRSTCVCCRMKARAA